MIAYTTEFGAHIRTPVAVKIYEEIVMVQLQLSNQYQLASSRAQREHYEKQLGVTIESLNDILKSIRENNNQYKHFSPNETLAFTTHINTLLNTLCPAKDNLTAKAKQRNGCGIL